MAGSQGHAGGRKRCSPNGELSGKENKAGKKARTEPSEVVGSGRQVAQGIDYEEKDLLKTFKEDWVTVKRAALCESEQQALAETGSGGGPIRRLNDFDVVDESGHLQPLEVLDLIAKPLFFSGMLNSVLLDISQAVAARTCTVLVWQLLNPESGGDPETSFSDLVIKLSRRKINHGYQTWKEALLLNGRFILKQLRKMTEQAAKSSMQFEETPFAMVLEQEVESQQLSCIPGDLRIGDDGGSSKVAARIQFASTEQQQLEADEDLARRLQAKEEARSCQGPRRGAKQTYIKINEEEIADDYPFPAQYEKEREEMDELLMADEGLLSLAPEELPKRILSDFAVYNSEGFFSSLELLPMWGGVDPDVELYASGTVTEDQGDWEGMAIDCPEAAGGSCSGPAAGSSSYHAAGSSSCPAGSSSAACAGSSVQNGGVEDQGGMRVFVSQIREWIAECTCDMLFISIRTDVAWYRLKSPLPAYTPWFNVVLKCARLAVKTIGMLTEETRLSRLSFNDVIKRLSEQHPEDETFISSKVQLVERFVVVHGQIILNQFSLYPKPQVQRCAFVQGLKELMEMRRHSKLYMPKKKTPVRRSIVNRNPMKDRTANARRKTLPAVATQLVKNIWQNYFPNSEAGAPEGKISNTNSGEDENEDEDDEHETNLDVSSPSRKRIVRGFAKKKVFELLGESTGHRGGRQFFNRAKAGNQDIVIGSVVVLEGDGDDDELGMVQCLWQTSKGEKLIQVRAMAWGRETVLGDAASEFELFLLDEFRTRQLRLVSNVLSATRLSRPWGASLRLSHMHEDEMLANKNAQLAAEGKSVHHFYRSVYKPREGMFCAVEPEVVLGKYMEEEEEALGGQLLEGCGQGFVKNGIEYKIGDYLYVQSVPWEPLFTESVAKKTADSAAKGRCHKGGSNRGLRAFGVCQLLKISTGGQRQLSSKGSAVTQVRVRKFYRPEDVDPDLGYKADYWDIYYSKDEAVVDVDLVVGKCRVKAPGAVHNDDVDTFVCTHSVDHKNPQKLGPAPSMFARQDGSGNSCQSKGVPALRLMDIFAGCGGLSEGLHKAGVVDTRWAIEYEEPAAEAFKLNHPQAAVFCNNSSTILMRAMTKCGLQGNCVGSEEVAKDAANLPESVVAQLPAPGEVDFIAGGPPCQGYSGMNRFNKGDWSVTQNSMVMCFLSFADLYRPRFFLLENVRNFIVHNGSQTFRLTLRTLLDMGYQVRFGVLNAGNFGVPQSRKRTFIWGAAPGERLPNWPTPMHVFHNPQLTIKLPGGINYTAVPELDGAPLRSVTVRDAIADLPPIENGADRSKIDYVDPPSSAFQKEIRNGSSCIFDHICKEMNELNLERCRCIPKNTPGADWSSLQELVRKDPSRAKFKGKSLVPWCLPHTADRHNNWRGLFGRLDVNGHFPTSTTDPQPMGKVGQVFHPEQDRIVSVRECARSQGFPDTFRFHGTVQQKHRQVGNAVPPPLATALGRELKKVIESAPYSS
ncbi:unnamed protein product [Ostreobium quekettii]|uniref:Cytosine-specific methyltransferase n=1 Tax=Ostreobium quekettii TaxID=121088 RepID=A0A8S1JFW1_9CHLO|nr:unnamed protein product [Ostreobium quekettii]